MIEYDWLKKEFIKLYAREPRVFRAPGRVNLIGEHTDYNGGFVLPMAINFETAIAAARRDDRKIRVFTVNYNESAEFDLNGESERRSGFWLNYVEGVARILEEKNYKIGGADLLIYSDVPTGAGLSSSAALEIAAGFALAEIFDQSIDRQTLALVGQQTEHEYLGAKVGIMDQFVSANAVEKHALLLDCRSLDFENVPLDTEDFAIVICDTNIKHEIAASGYNTRRAECEKAVEILREFYPFVSELRDVSLNELNAFADKMPETILRRARHIVTENERVLSAAKALKNNDLQQFGALMFASHASMRDDFEISCRELDWLVEIAEKIEGVSGARMTGGGFGGSTVNLVKKTNLENFKEIIRRKYFENTGIEPTILISEAANGASEIHL